MAVSEKRSRPRIAVTMGDPCGVGPEVIVKAITSADVREECLPVVIGDRRTLLRAADLVGGRTIRVIRGLSDIEDSVPEAAIYLLPASDLSPEDIVYGKPSKNTCMAVVKYIETAARLAQWGEVQAICTCPLHKASLQKHGFPFPGHTEFLKDLTGATDVVMMLAGPRLRVALATIHNSLKDVPVLLTRDLLTRTIQITGEALLADFGLDPVRIAVAGLNPHAGEEGRFGREEIDLIQPVVESFRTRPFAVSGPFPPDTIFFRAYEGEFDAVVAMYHDQGLIPIKLVHFHDAVNVSLGLPIIRTSVDHGTAYDIAGTGRAHAGSLTAAVLLAASMVRNREAHQQSKG